MTISFATQGMPVKASVQVIRLCNTIILKKGYGSYTAEDRRFSAILYLNETTDEINQIMSLIEEYVVEFSRVPNETEVNEAFDECDTRVDTTAEAEVEAEADTDVDVDADVDVQNQDKYEDGETVKLEAKMESSTETESKTQAELKNEEEDHSPENKSDNADTAITKTVFTKQEAVDEFLKDEKGERSPEEIAKLVINNLYLASYFRDTSIEGISHIIINYVGLGEKPKSFNQIKKAIGNVPLNTQRQTKLNAVTKELFERRYGVTISFPELLYYVCEKISTRKDESSDESEPEEVILEPLERPPNKEEKSEKIGRPEELPEFIQSFNPDIGLRERTKELVNFMGLPRFETTSKTIVERLFFSIIFNKETNLERLFNIDISLKKLTTAIGAMKILKNFIGAFFQITVDDEFVDEFFKDLINNFSTAFSVKAKVPIRFQFKVQNLDFKVKQEPGELKCFPKNEDFDSFVKKVRHQRNKPIDKIRKILIYMKYNKESKEDAKIIYKTCTNLILIESYYAVDKLCQEHDQNVVISFINKFAKSLNKDAKFVKLSEFLKSLKEIIKY